MVTYANVIPTAGSDGVLYSNSVPLTTTEADVGDSLVTPSPIAVEYGQVIVAVVKLAINGIVVGSNAYVVMQSDAGDGNWVDVAWCVTTFNQGSVIFVLCGGGLGAMNNAFQQSRQVGAFPSTTGSNVVPLAGRVRFVGKATAVGGSSSTPGTGGTAVSATVRYKLMAPR
jgi:hypothetical protein